MDDDIAKAVALFRSSLELDDEVVYILLVRQGIERKRASRLVEFLPIVYCRLILRNSGARFSDRFQRLLPGDAVREEAFADDPLWNETFAFAQREVEHGVSAKDLLAVAMRSADFDAANQLLNKGSKLRDLVFAPTVFMWPDDGPETKAESSKSQT